MVNKIEIYKCPYCSEEYTDYDEAVDCAKECIAESAEDPVSIIRYRCEYCNNEYRHASKAEECEERHQRNKDKSYDDFLTRQSLELLAKAAKNPAQKRLI